MVSMAALCLSSGETLPPLNCLHCSLLLQGSMGALQLLTDFFLCSAVIHCLPCLPLPQCFKQMRGWEGKSEDEKRISGHEK